MPNPLCTHCDRDRGTLIERAITADELQFKFECGRCGNRWTVRV